jgi:hypothetical protein
MPSNGFLSLAATSHLCSSSHARAAATARRAPCEVMLLETRAQEATDFGEPCARKHLHEPSFESM